MLKPVQSPGLANERAQVYAELEKGVDPGKLARKLAVKYPEEEAIVSFVDTVLAEVWCVTASTFQPALAGRMRSGFSSLTPSLAQTIPIPFPTKRRLIMPLLEIAQNRRYVSAMVRLEETTAQRINQYAGFMNTTADEVVDKALAYVFARDKDFQEWLQKPEAGRVQQLLRMRRLGQNGSASDSGNGTAKHSNVPAPAAGPRSPKSQTEIE